MANSMQPQPRKACKEEPKQRMPAPATHVAQDKVDKLLDAVLAQVGAETLLGNELVLLECHEAVLGKHVVVRTYHCTCVRVHTCWCWCMPPCSRTETAFIMTMMVRASILNALKKLES